MVEWSSLAEEESMMRLLQCLVLAEEIRFWTLFVLFFVLINLSVDSEFRGAPSTFCLPTLALGLTDFRRVPRCVRTVGQETCGSGCMLI